MLLHHNWPKSKLIQLQVNTTGGSHCIIRLKVTLVANRVNHAKTFLLPEIEQKNTLSKMLGNRGKPCCFSGMQKVFSLVCTCKYHKYTTCFNTQWSTHASSQLLSCVLWSSHCELIHRGLWFVYYISAGEDVPPKDPALHIFASQCESHENRDMDTSTSDIVSQAEKHREKVSKLQCTGEVL